MKYGLLSLLVWALLSPILLGQAIVNQNSITSTDNGHSAVPRFSAHPDLFPKQLIVPANTTQTLPAIFDYDVIEISGTLRISRDFDTTGKVTVIQILPGGSLDCGSLADPVLRKVDITFKNIPLQTGTDGSLGVDPEQFGNGINNFGELKSYGRTIKKTWTTIQPLPNAGATIITLTDVDTTDWQVGDSLLFSDSRLPVLYPEGYALPQPDNRPMRKESPVTILAISGNTITLSKPLDFEHDVMMDSHSNVLQMPLLANTTRNIVFHSEDPHGVRGHIMAMDMAHMDLYYTAFVGMGRTLAKTLDSFDSHTLHIGLNQIARYGIHWHHVHGHANDAGFTGTIVGCLVDAIDTAKWNIVQHATHDLLVQNNVSINAAGACYTTAEDGYETRGQYRQNFAYGATGNLGLYGNNGNARFNVLSVAVGGQNTPGGDGSGFWGKGSGSLFSGNIAVNCRIGYVFVHQVQVLGIKVPSIPGGVADTDADPSISFPISFDNNTSLACDINGFEGWALPVTWQLRDSKLLNSTQRGILAGQGIGDVVDCLRCQIVNDYLGYFDSYGIESSYAYSSELHLQDSVIEGFGTGLFDIRWIDFVLKNVRLRNWEYNINWSRTDHIYQPSVLDNVTFEHFRDNGKSSGQGVATAKLPDTTIDLIIGKGGTTPVATVDLWEYVYSSKFTTVDNLYPVTNWKGSGKNYLLYEIANAPPGAIPLDGLVNALAVEQGTPPPPPPANNPPVVSVISTDPPDVDTTTPGVQEYAGSTVTYSSTATDPDSDPLTVKVYYTANGGTKTAYPITSTLPSVQWSFTYGTTLPTYVWTVEATDSKGAVTSQSLTVQIVAKPITPPPPPAGNPDLDAYKAKVSTAIDQIIVILRTLQ